MYKTFFKSNLQTAYLQATNSRQSPKRNIFTFQTSLYLLRESITLLKKKELSSANKVFLLCTMQLVASKIAACVTALIGQNNNLKLARTHYYYFLKNENCINPHKILMIISCTNPPCIIKHNNFK